MLLSRKFVETQMRLADEGNIDALVYMAELYSSGVNSTSSKAYELEEFLGDRISGILKNKFIQGEGITQNKELAFTLWEKAAKGGHVDTIKRLGEQYYFEGEHKKALKWLISAAELKSFGTFYILGNIYMNIVDGGGEVSEKANVDFIKKDPIEALKWYTLAEQADQDPLVSENIQGLEAQLTGEQIAAGKKLADEWKEKFGILLVDANKTHHFKDYVTIGGYRIPGLIIQAIIQAMHDNASYSQIQTDYFKYFIPIDDDPNYTNEEAIIEELDVFLHCEWLNNELKNQ